MWREKARIDGSNELRDLKAAYEAVFGSENEGLSPGNYFFWDIYC
jgi:hypothetical protein